jgi:hypothetical protein
MNKFIQPVANVLHSFENFFDRDFAVAKVVGSLAVGSLAGAAGSAVAETDYNNLVARDMAGLAIGAAALTGAAIWAQLERNRINRNNENPPIEPDSLI